MKTTTLLLFFATAMRRVRNVLATAAVASLLAAAGPAQASNIYFMYTAGTPVSYSNDCRPENFMQKFFPEGLTAAGNTVYRGYGADLPSTPATYQWVVLMGNADYTGYADKLKGYVQSGGKLLIQAGGGNVCNMPNMGTTVSTINTITGGHAEIDPLLGASPGSTISSSYSYDWEGYAGYGGTLSYGSCSVDAVGNGFYPIRNLMGAQLATSYLSTNALYDGTGLAFGSIATVGKGVLVTLHDIELWDRFYSTGQNLNKDLVNFFFGTGKPATGTTQSCFEAPPSASLTIKKITSSGTGAFTFNGTATNANGFSTNGSYAVSTSAANTAASGSSVTLTATNTLTEVAETSQPGWVLQSATCTDANAATTGNPASFGTLSGNTLQIPAANVRAGAALQCTYTNAPAPVTLAVRQLVLRPIPINLVAPFTFSYSGNNGWSTPPLVSPDVNTLTASNAVALAATNTATTVSVNFPEPRYFISRFSCADSNAPASGNPTGLLVDVKSTTLTIPAANVRAGAALRCTAMIGHYVP
jgi:hypothetical protein